MDHIIPGSGLLAADIRRTGHVRAAATARPRAHIAMSVILNIFFATAVVLVCRGSVLPVIEAFIVLGAL